MADAISQPYAKPRWTPLPGLLYAQVIKQYRRKRLVGVKHHVVFGTLGAIEQVLAGCGWKLNTAFVERLNLDMGFFAQSDAYVPQHIFGDM